MLSALVFIASLTPAKAKTPVDIDRMAVRQVVSQNHPSAKVDNVILHGDYAVALGASPSGPIREGLHRTRSGWQIACSIGAAPSATSLQTACKFPAAIATEMSANLSAQAAVERGDFPTAMKSEQRAFMSATGPDREQERARVQLLRQLSEQMRMGMITRSQGIQKWSQFRYSWMLPGGG